MADLSFTVEYKKDIPLRFLSRNKYFTIIDEMENGNSTNNNIQILNEEYTIQVEGFFGMIVVLKLCMLYPRTFMIAEICDHITLIQ